MAELLYQGHGSYRIAGSAGIVIYVDPYAGQGYDEPADLVLVTHEHADHNQVGLVTLKEGGKIIRAGDLHPAGEYRAAAFRQVRIEATEAYNAHHRKEDCVGYLIRLDGITFYAAGDTSRTEEMARLAGRGIDYAALPIDGIYNMGPAEAAACAKLIRARWAIPVHMAPGKLFDRAAAERFKAPGRLILAPGETREL